MFPRATTTAPSHHPVNQTTTASSTLTILLHSHCGSTHPTHAFRLLRQAQSDEPQPCSDPFFTFISNVYSPNSTCLLFSIIFPASTSLSLICFSYSLSHLSLPFHLNLPLLLPLPLLLLFANLYIFLCYWPQ